MTIDPSSLDALEAEIRVLHADPATQEFLLWHGRAERALKRAVGESDDIVNKFRRIRWQSGGMYTEPHHHREAFERGRAEALALLTLASEEAAREPTVTVDSTALVPSAGAPRSPGSAQVFVVHGRDDAARRALFEFLRALGLEPLEWSQAVALTGTGSPYIGAVLDAAFRAASAVVVLLTPDDVAYLRTELADGAEDPAHAPAAQPRPNVLFEAGLAFGRQPDRTVLVELGDFRRFSDVEGRHAVRLDGSPENRTALATRLRTAGCPVNMTGTDWLSAGAFVPMPPPGAARALGRRLPSQPRNAVSVDARSTNTATTVDLRSAIEAVNRSLASKSLYLKVQAYSSSAT
jgi:predicted nucleotide-binding protein